MKLIFSKGPKFDLNQEFKYWYEQLKKEYSYLKELSSRPLEDEVEDDSLDQIIAQRVEILNGFLVGKITKNENLDNEAVRQMEELIEDRQNFMDSTRKSFIVSHPAIMEYLKQRGLTERETNICCLHMIGLRSKEIGAYLGLRSHYNISSSIRHKLGLDTSGTNLGIYLRHLIKDPSNLEKLQVSDINTNINNISKDLSSIASRACVLASAYFMSLTSFIYMVPNWVNTTAYVYLLMNVVGLWSIFKTIYLYRRETILILRKCSKNPYFNLSVWACLALIFCHGLIPENLYTWVSNATLLISIAILTSGLINSRTAQSHASHPYNFTFLCICYGAWSVVVFFIAAYLLIGFNIYNRYHEMPSFFEIFDSENGIPWYFICLWTVLMFFAGYGIRRFIGSHCDILSNFFGFLFHWEK